MVRSHRFIQVHDAGFYIFPEFVHGWRLDYNPAWFMVTGHIQIISFSFMIRINKMKFNFSTYVLHRRGLMSLDSKLPTGWSIILEMEAFLKLFQWRKMNLTLKHCATSTEDLMKSERSFLYRITSFSEPIIEYEDFLRQYQYTYQSSVFIATTLLNCYIDIIDARTGFVHKVLKYRLINTE